MGEIAVIAGSAKRVQDMVTYVAKPIEEQQVKMVLGKYLTLR